MKKPGSMLAPEVNKVTLKKAATRILVWLASGALSGAVTACLVTMAGWLLQGDAPTAFLRPDSSGEFYHVVELTPIQLVLVLARFLVHDGFAGALLGLLGGTVPAFISCLYWKRIGGLKQTAIMSGIFGILWVEWNLPEADLPDFRMVTGFGTTGAVFGLLLVLVARLLCILLEAWERGRHEGRAVFPAWLRLLIYLPCAAVLYVVGIVLASDLAAAYLTPGTEGQATAMGPGALAFAVYMDLPLVVLFTLWFARQIDRRTWREIGLILTPGTSRQLLLGCVLGTTVVVLVGAYALLGLVSIHRTEESVWEVVLYGLLIWPAVGFSEELVFRGYLLPNLVQVVGRTSAIWLSAILFWALHLISPDAGEPFNAISHVLFGVLCVLCYLATGSLWVPIGLHAIYDFIAVGVLRGPPRLHLPCIFSVEFHAPAWLVGEPGKAGLGALVFLLLLIGMVWRWLYRPAMLAEKEKEAKGLC